MERNVFTFTQHCVGVLRGEQFAAEKGANFTIFVERSLAKYEPGITAGNVKIRIFPGPCVEWSMPKCDQLFMHSQFCPVAELSQHIHRGKLFSEILLGRLTLFRMEKTGCILWSCGVKFSRCRSNFG